MPCLRAKISIYGVMRHKYTTITTAAPVVCLIIPGIIGILKVSWWRVSVFVGSGLQYPTFAVVVLEHLTVTAALFLYLTYGAL